MDGEVIRGLLYSLSLVSFDFTGNERNVFCSCYLCDKLSFLLARVTITMMLNAKVATLGEIILHYRQGYGLIQLCYQPHFLYDYFTLKVYYEVALIILQCTTKAAAFIVTEG